LNNIVFNTIFGSCPVDISDEDILDAMKSIPGYLDITPGDFKEIFRHAYRHAIERIAQSLVAKDVMTAKLISVTPNTSLKETSAKRGYFRERFFISYGRKKDTFNNGGHCPVFIKQRVCRRFNEHRFRKRHNDIAGSHGI